MSFVDFLREYKADSTAQSYYSRTPVQVWNESFASHLVDRQNAWLLVPLKRGGLVNEASVRQQTPQSCKILCWGKGVWKRLLLSHNHKYSFIVANMVSSDQIKIQKKHLCFSFTLPSSSVYSPCRPSLLDLWSRQGKFTCITYCCNLS